MPTPEENQLAPGQGLPAPVCSGWVDAATKPRTGKKVLVCGIYSNGNRFRALACWYPAGTLDASMWDDPPDEWWIDDDLGERCVAPESAWWEASAEIEEMCELENITHWMDLPAMPPHPYTQNVEFSGGPTGQLNNLGGRGPSAGTQG